MKRQYFFSWSPSIWSNLAALIIVPLYMPMMKTEAPLWHFSRRKKIPSFFWRGMRISPVFPHKIIVNALSLPYGLWQTQWVWVLLRIEFALAWSKLNTFAIGQVCPFCFFYRILWGLTLLIRSLQFFHSDSFLFFFSFPFLFVMATRAKKP